MILLKTLIKEILSKALLKIFETKEYGIIMDSIPLKKVEQKGYHRNFENKQ